ncbi:MAG: hypothetical protein R2880_15975 [Deinococcales bacterium]
MFKASAQVWLSDNSWQQASDGNITIFTVNPDDTFYLPELFRMVQEAQKELEFRQISPAKPLELSLPEQIHIIVHPNLASFQQATAMPWYIAAIARKSQEAAGEIHLQRLRVLMNRHRLKQSLRHELFHLAQPDSLRRYQAEALAMRFAGEVPKVEAFIGLSEDRLDALLAAPSSADELEKALATAYRRFLEGP